MDEGPRRYAAFLSYCHKDAAAARAVHRRLESYRIPRRLVGSAGERGPVPARLVPIFRDREELPAAGDLSVEVRAALAASDALVILCSPAAAASQWVAKEIDTFRSLHPDRPVIAAILDGEPAAAFPPNLAAGGIEPLAADLRSGRDGKRLGLLKLVAGLSGVHLDALVQRDAQRRLRRVTAVTAVAVAAMLAMAILTAVALTARAEAQRQRAEAEGLVEFMLTDLRNRLRTVGRLDIMEAVNARTLQHYRTYSSEHAADRDAMRRRARILHAVGEDELTVGNVQRALAVFQEAYKSTSEQVARNPHDLDLQLDNARSVYWIGRVYEVGRDWLRAAERYRLFAADADRLIAADPRNPDYMKEAGWSRVDLGNVALNGFREFRAAQRYYEQAITWFNRAMKTRPEDDTARVLANAEAWLADSYYMQGKFMQSLRARERQQKIARALLDKYPEDLDEVYRLGTAQRALARSLLKVGRVADGRAELAPAVAASRRLTQHDPRNGEWLLFRASIDCDLLFTRLGRRDVSARRELARDVRASAATLAAAGNPRAAELSRCVAATTI